MMFSVLGGMCAGAAVQEKPPSRLKQKFSIDRSNERKEDVPDIRFETSTDHFTTYFTPKGMILAGFSRQAEQNSSEPQQYFELEIFLQNALKTLEITTLNPRLSRSDFFGSLSPSWLTKIPNYAKIKYANVYPDVDLLFQMKNRALEFDFVIAPGGDISDIRFQVKGAQRIRFTAEGSLLLEVRGFIFELPKLVGYQVIDETPARSVVHVEYVLAAKNEIGLRVSPYNSKRTLLIHR
jgi:hypothetical protein